MSTQARRKAYEAYAVSSKLGDRPQRHQWKRVIFETYYCPVERAWIAWAWSLGELARAKSKHVFLGGRGKAQARAERKLEEPKLSSAAKWQLTNLSMSIEAGKPKAIAFMRTLHERDLVLLDKALTEGWRP